MLQKIKGSEWAYLDDAEKADTIEALSDKISEMLGLKERPDISYYDADKNEFISIMFEMKNEADTTSTKKNLELRAEAEHGACAGKLAIAKRAKELGYDAIHDTVHEMAKDEARHGKGFDGLLKRYFS